MPLACCLRSFSYYFQYSFRYFWELKNGFVKPTTCKMRNALHCMCFIVFLRSTCIHLPATVIRMGHFKVLRFPASLYLKVYTTMWSPISNICPDLVPSGVIVTSKSGLFSVHLNVGWIQRTGALSPLLAYCTSGMIVSQPQSPAKEIDYNWPWPAMQPGPPFYTNVSVGKIHWHSWKKRIKFSEIVKFGYKIS